MKEFKAAEMTKEALSDKGWVLADFWAPWCGPCRMMAPVLEQAAALYEGRVTVGKVNIDEEADAAIRYGVSAIPTLILLHNGEEAARMVGAQPLNALRKALDEKIND